jgi:hypothetical protein
MLSIHAILLSEGCRKQLLTGYGRSPDSLLVRAIRAFLGRLAVCRAFRLPGERW